MEDDTGKEIIFESWMYKLSGTQKHRMSLSYTGAWKRRYFILERDGQLPSLHYFTKKPKSDKAVPKGCLELSSLYRIEKRPAMKGKPFVCQIVTGNKQLVLATEDEKMFHLLVFFVQAQTKIKDELEGDCLVVRPDNTDDQRCIGARGNMCLLHVSESGITLALQLSKCILAQWPLKCIKFYESTGMGQFGFETGKQSPSGEGKYFFNTRRGQDNHIYDLLDRYVMEADSFRQIAAARLTNSANERSSVMADLDQLQNITWVCSDARFIGHLKRISRDIYDNLAVHLGGNRSGMSRNQSDPDLLSDTVSHGHAAAQHDRSCGVQDVSCASSCVQTHVDISVHPSSHTAPPSEHYVAAGTSSVPPLMKKVSGDSQYLHMADSCNSSFSSVSPDRYINANMTAPPTFYEVMKSCEATANVSIGTSTPIDDCPPRPMLLRQQSHSCEELGPYQKMGAEALPLSYENQTFATSDESAQFVNGVYSYASPLGTRGSLKPSAAGHSNVIPRVHHHAEFLKLSRKSLSNPNLGNGVDLGQSAFSSSHHDVQHRPSPFNFQLINSHGSANGKRDDHFTDVHDGAAALATSAATPSPKSVSTSVNSPGFLKGVQFTDKSRSFVKRQVTPTETTQVAPSNQASGENPENIAASRNMEGRQLPTIPDTAVKETSC